MAAGSEGERKTLKDIISHSHPLSVQVLQQFTSDANKPPRRCEACKEEILSGHYYTCASNSSSKLECNFFMHKCCGDLANQLQHHLLHSQHTLSLRNDNRSFTCQACLTNYENLIYYYCRLCKFNFDIGCITLKERKIKHKCHEHQLTPQRIPTLSLCNACGLRHEGIFYQCSECVMYSIHRDCASLPETITHTHHVHSLDLYYGFPANVSIAATCNICREYIHPFYSTVHMWVYYCQGCRYVAHVNCAVSKKELTLSPSIKVNPRHAYIDSIALRFPIEGVVNELVTISMISRFLMDKDDDGNNKETTITHWSHSHHPLILHEETLFGESGSPFAKKCFVPNKCDGCGRAIITSPFWRCSKSECHFFLHKCCTQLRLSIHQHPSHPEHPLVLRAKPLEFFRALKCDCCRKLFNGFAYQCKEKSCQFYIDVECASLPSTIIHQVHQDHPLVVTKVVDTYRYCDCCGDNFDYNEYRYGCQACYVDLHLRCVLYPGRVNHRFDKHPFKLTYIPLQSQREDESYCEICQKFVDPLTWFYCCDDCDRFMHPHCLFSIDLLIPKLKYFEISDDYKVDCHPHQLAIFFTYMDRCDHCDQKDATQQQDEEDPSRYWLVYRCTEYDCDYKIQARCAISCNLRKGKKQLFKLFPQLP